MRVINLMTKYLDILRRVELPCPGVIQTRSFKSYSRLYPALFGRIARTRKWLICPVTCPVNLCVYDFAARFQHECKPTEN
jgi:hypothetical protein